MNLELSDPVLIVDPDSDAASALATHLAARGFSVDTRSEGEEALGAAQRQPYGAFIIRAELPKVDGVSVCRFVRATLQSAAPILVVSETAQLHAKLEAFQDGADDFLTKPLSSQEVELRIRSRIMRWRRSSAEPVRRVGDLVLDRSMLYAMRAGVPLCLTRTTFRMLELLVCAHPHILPRDELVRAIWGDHVPKSDALRSHLYQLRKQLNRRPWPPMMRTVRSIGFQLVAPADAGNDPSK